MSSELASDFELHHAATDRATIVTVPERRMFAVDGLGEPAAGPYRLAMDALYDAVEGVRATLHRRRVETRRAPIECAWWSHPEPRPDQVAAAFADRRPWHWQLMIELPAAATEEEVQARATDRTETSTPLRVVHFLEGLSAQILHVGPVGGEAAAVQRLYELVLGQGLHPHGHLHEIHLTDPRRVSDDRRRTIIRLPIVRIDGPHP